MNATMLEVLQALARVDQSRRELGLRLEALPSRIAKAEAIGTRLKAELTSLERELDGAMKLRRQREQEATDLVARTTRDSTALHTIRNNTEYQALLKQMAEAKSRQTELENEALQLMEREEELSRRIKSERTRVDAELAALASERGALEEEGRRLEASLAEKNHERTRLMGDLDGELRARYERLCRSQVLAVVPVVKGACSGCFSALPPQRVNEARLGERLVLCDACSRILIWNEESGSQ